MASEPPATKELIAILLRGHESKDFDYKAASEWDEADKKACCELVKDILVPMRQPTTYREIQKWVKTQFGFTPETCWIAHCKELNGLTVGETPNRRGDERSKPCLPDKRPAIRKAFQHFGMVEDLR